MTGISIISTKLPDKRADVESVECKDTKVSRKALLCIVIGFSALIAIGVGIAAVWTGVFINGHKTESVKHGTVFIRTAEGETLTEDVTARGEVEEEFKLVGQGTVIYDYKRFLMVMHFDSIDDLCFVAVLNDTVKKVQDIPRNKEVIVLRNVVTNMYTNTGGSVDHNLLPQSAQRLCKASLWMTKSDEEVGIADTKRIKRRCTRSCIIVCRPGGSCRRECTKNPCPRNDPIWV